MGPKVGARLLLFPGCEDVPRTASGRRIAKRDTPFIKRMRELERISPAYADVFHGIVNRAFEEGYLDQEGGA